MKYSKAYSGSYQKSTMNFSVKMVTGLEMSDMVLNTPLVLLFTSLQHKIAQS